MEDSKAINTGVPCDQPGNYRDPGTFGMRHRRFNGAWRKNSGRTNRSHTAGHIGYIGFYRCEDQLRTAERGTMDAGGDLYRRGRSADADIMYDIGHKDERLFYEHALCPLRCGRRPVDRL